MARFTVDSQIIVIDLPSGMLEKMHAIASTNPKLAEDGVFKMEMLRLILGDFLLPNGLFREHSRAVACRVLEAGRACPAIKGPELAQCLILHGHLPLLRRAIEESWPIAREAHHVVDHPVGGRIEVGTVRVDAFYVFRTDLRATSKTLDLVNALLLAADAVPQSVWFRIAAYVAASSVWYKTSMRSAVLSAVQTHSWPEGLIDDLVTFVYLEEPDEEDDRAVRIADELLKMGCPFDVEGCADRAWTRRKQNCDAWWDSMRLPRIVRLAVEIRGVSIPDRFVQLACYHRCRSSIDWMVRAGVKFEARHVGCWAEGCRLRDDIPLKEFEIEIGQILLQHVNKRSL